MDTLTEMELAARGFSIEELRTAVARGQLRGTPHGQGFLFRASDIAEWAEKSAVSGGRRVEPRKSAAPTAPAPRQANAPAAGADPVAAWNGIINRLVAGGVPRAEAIKATDANHPGLREAMLRAHNTAVRRQSDLAEARAAVDRAARQRV